MFRANAARHFAFDIPTHASSISLRQLKALQRRDRHPIIDGEVASCTVPVVDGKPACAKSASPSVCDAADTKALNPCFDKESIDSIVKKLDLVLAGIALAMPIKSSYVGIDEF